MNIDVHDDFTINSKRLENINEKSQILKSLIKYQRLFDHSEIEKMIQIIKDEDAEFSNQISAILQRKIQERKQIITGKVLKEKNYFVQHVETLFLCCYFSKTAYIIRVF